jgi:hypothetical protein
VYMVPAAARQVCTISNWGYGEIRRDCRSEALPPRHGNRVARHLHQVRAPHLLLIRCPQSD